MMRRFTPLALLATVVAAFIVAKGCLPKDNIGSKAASSAAPDFPAGQKPLAEPARSTPQAPR